MAAVIAPSKIAQIEDALIAKTKQLFGNKLRTVDWAPPDWDEDFIKRMLLGLPGVFVVFGGVSNPEPGSTSLRVITNWSLVAVTRHVQDAKQRARGDSLEIGCYQMLELLAPQLDGFTLDDIGTFSLMAWNNSEALKLEKQALMIQEIELSMLIDLPRAFDAGTLDAFITYHDTFNVGQPPGAPATEDFVRLE